MIGEAQSDRSDEPSTKQRREELELLKLEHEINTRIIENRIKEQTRILSLGAELDRVGDARMCKRARRIYQETLQDMILGPQVPPQAQDNEIITLIGVATDKGYEPTPADISFIEKDLGERYLKQYNKAPPKFYTKKDLPLMEKSLHSYFQFSDSDSDV